MANQTDTSLDLTDADKVLILQEFRAQLDSDILYSLFHGIYTGVVAVTLGNIFMNKSRAIRQAMVVVIILLHIVTTINFGLASSFIRSIFVDNGQNFGTKYLFYYSPGIVLTVGMGVTSAICTILADTTIIWRCWIVWGRRWLPILLPILLLISATAFKIIVTYKLYTTTNDYPLYFILYSSTVLATTLWCTFLIIYRIVTVARAGDKAGGGVRAYRHVIEILVESSALYSISLIAYMALYARNDKSLLYFDVIAGIARGISPTLLVGRVAAGHARPDDSWQGSVISGSLRFRVDTHPIGQDSLLDSVASDDLEAQVAKRERDEESSHHALVESQYAEDDLEAQPNRPEDDPHTILIVAKD